MVIAVSIHEEEAARTHFPRVMAEMEGCHALAVLGFASFLESQAFDPSDPDIFSTMIREAIDHYDLNASELANEFGVNVSTVTRWAAGKNAPHRMVRPHIAEWIRLKLESDLQQSIRQNLNSEGDLRELNNLIQCKFNKIVTL